MSTSSTLTLARSGRPARRIGLVALALLTLLTSGCFRLVDKETFAIGFETNRANLVVHTRSTSLLYAYAKGAGSGAARSMVIARTPAKIKITTVQRGAICAVSLALCFSADVIGRTLVSWFKSDIRHRDDFSEALTSAGRNGRCFAWTFVPSRNLTHKGLGTSGCKAGEA